jgi:16S rRNA (uracil1498-N3)-methyltransferase
VSITCQKSQRNGVAGTNTPSHNPRMRRILVANAAVGRIELTGPQAHHLRDVLRLAAGEKIEVFDRTGARGSGVLAASDPSSIILQIDKVSPAPPQRLLLTIASAIPKGSRADWMIEKLSELGVDIFIPLAAERSVVLPRGVSKSDRWQRLAEEAAEQSARTGVMQIDPLTDLHKLIQHIAAAQVPAWYLAPSDDADPILRLVQRLPPALILLIGPEGGWSPAEISMFREAAIAPLRLTSTILRVETAAVSAAAIIQSSLTLVPFPATILD